MRRYSSRHALQTLSELNITPLLDLAFVLLIIFMITTPLIQSEQTIPVNLPVESKKAQDVLPETEFQVVSIDKAGNFYFGQKRVSFSELSSNLTALAAKPKQPVIRIRADLSLQWQQVVRVMDVIKKNNLTKITFDTDAK
jgi:biopolymer transport protein ExbD